MKNLVSSILDILELSLLTNIYLGVIFIFENALVKKETLINVIQNIEYNKDIISFYGLLAEEIQQERKQTILNKIDNIKDCNSLWDIDYYRISKIKDFKKTNLCKDKFCNNCKKVKQSGRMAKYMPELEQYKNNSFLMTLTSPSVMGIELKDKIKKMSKSYSQLNRYLSGNIKIRGIDFSSWGYLGAVRSLEVTFKGDNYHPHYHILLILDKLILSDKKNINDFSYHYGKLRDGFSDQEIIIQKIWYLIINDIKVTKNNIDNLDIGYSCKIDKLGPNDYNEIFKYMTKGTTEDNKKLNYNQFKVLNDSLFRVKQIQGYGCLYSIKDDFDLDSMIEEYDKLIEQLKNIENPLRVLETPGDLLKDKDIKLISRKSYFKYLQQIDN